MPGETNFSLYSVIEDMKSSDAVSFLWENALYQPSHSDRLKVIGQTLCGKNAVLKAAVEGYKANPNRIDLSEMTLQIHEELPITYPDTHSVEGYSLYPQGTLPQQIEDFERFSDAPLIRDCQLPTFVLYHLLDGTQSVDLSITTVAGGRHTYLIAQFPDATNLGENKIYRCHYDPRSSFCIPTTLKPPTNHYERGILNEDPLLEFFSNTNSRSNRMALLDSFTAVSVLFDTNQTLFVYAAQRFIETYKEEFPHHPHLAYAQELLDGIQH